MAVHVELRRKLSMEGASAREDAFHAGAWNMRLKINRPRCAHVHPRPRRRLERTRVRACVRNSEVAVGMKNEESSSHATHCYPAARITGFHYHHPNENTHRFLFDPFASLCIVHPSPCRLDILRTYTPSFTHDSSWLGPSFPCVITSASEYFLVLGKKKKKKKKILLVPCCTLR
jgi:hypothetical protein